MVVLLQLSQQKQQQKIILVEKMNWIFEGKNMEFCDADDSDIKSLFFLEGNFFNQIHVIRI